MKCKYCNKIVFECIWDGIKMIRELNKDRDVTSPHFCNDFKLEGAIK